MKTYHATSNQDLKEILKGEGDYAGIFTGENVSLTANGDYGDYVYRVTFDSVCEASDIEEYLDNNPAFLTANPNFVVDCDDAEQDDVYFANQKLRALIAIELGFDAVEENDGWLVVNGKVELIGHRKSEAVETEIEENW